MFLPLGSCSCQDYTSILIHLLLIPKTPTPTDRLHDTNCIEWLKIMHQLQEENEEPTSTNDDIEIKIVRVTTNGDSSNPGLFYFNVIKIGI